MAGDVADWNRDCMGKAAGLADGGDQTGWVRVAIQARGVSSAIRLAGYVLIRSSTSVR